MAKRQAQYLTLAEALSAASRPFHAFPLPVLTRGSILFTAGLIAKGLLRTRRSPKDQEAVILAAAYRLMRHIVEFLELAACDAETAAVVAEAQALVATQPPAARGDD